ncbi:hypothetical protein T07_10108 [Trichinella nelsoni]|uniref:Uncharacterized protein n=1 Tax=Trichinella nelsoni TaxID=6336 RepID=A0A0V0RR06_9BILA|nr:hypothetical protein T07_10108 [Trichinella nelsoni]
MKKRHYFLERFHSNSCTRFHKKRYFFASSVTSVTTTHCSISEHIQVFMKVPVSKNQKTEKTAKNNTFYHHFMENAGEYE